MWPYPLVLFALALVLWFVIWISDETVNAVSHSRLWPCCETPPSLPPPVCDLLQTLAVSSAANNIAMATDWFHDCNILVWFTLQLSQKCCTTSAGSGSFGWHRFGLIVILWLVLHSRCAAVTVWVSSLLNRKAWCFADAAHVFCHPHHILVRQVWN